MLNTHFNTCFAIFNKVPKYSKMPKYKKYFTEKQLINKCDCIDPKRS